MRSAKIHDENDRWSQMLEAGACTRSIGGRIAAMVLPSGLTTRTFGPQIPRQKRNFHPAGTCL